jgi:ATP-binding cassette subfamily B protein
VFQESFLFSTTVAANIAFGHPDATQEQVEKAARIAACHDFIMAMPKGYETVLGEGGIGLSGGQRQRLAIARAVLLEPAILLLDDPTAAVDPGTEHEIVEAMNSAMASRTTFLVAHRLSMLRRADVILVLEGGRIVQRGTHEQLMSAQGYYRRAAEMQVADEESRRLLATGSKP